MQSIEAQNRTTHAVRALAKFLAIQLVYGFFGAIFIVASIFQQSSDPNIYGWLIIGAGTLHSIYACISELDKSSIRHSVRTNANNDASSRAIAYNEFNAREYRAWVKYGEPDLDQWVKDGRPDFINWLTEYSDGEAPKK